MNFSGNKAIYLQIAEHAFEQILLGRWSADEKIPSVRELAVQLEVNPNTVMRTYDFLQQMEVIYNKRGIGFFVADDALKQDRKSTRLNSSHVKSSYAVFCLKKKTHEELVYQ